MILLHVSEPSVMNLLREQFTVGFCFFVLHSHMQRVNELARAQENSRSLKLKGEGPKGKALKRQHNLLFCNLLHHQLRLGESLIFKLAFLFTVSWIVCFLRFVVPKFIL